MIRGARSAATRDAVTSARRATTLLAALGLLVLTLLGRPGVTDDASSDRDTLAVESTELADIDTIDAELTRSSPIRAIALPVSMMTLALVACVVVSELIGRCRRRIGDDGDVWRSLLFGAPPVVA
jgi:hypothetical protein